MLKLAMTVLWPSFLTAAMADGFFFSLFDPAATDRSVHDRFFLFLEFWCACQHAQSLSGAHGGR